MFQPEIATAMAAYFLTQAEGRKLNDLILMKLMVIAERLCMDETTSLISGAHFASMRHGPVLSEALDLMRGSAHNPIWNDHIEVRTNNTETLTTHHRVLTHDLPIEGYLSEYEVSLLQRVWCEHKDDTEWGIDDIIREFGEWDASCVKSNTAKEIDLESIYRLGFGEPAGIAKQRAQEIEFFETVSV